MTASRLPAASLLFLILSACSAQTMQPHFQRNPHPKDAYKLRVVFKNPPGPLQPYAASGSYGVSNLPCAVLKDIVPTHANQPVADAQFVMNKVAENTYEGVFYIDAMEDKDYYGNGVCHWELQGVSAGFRASNTPGESVFSVGFPMTDVITHQPTEYMKGVHTTMYFSKMDYPRVKGFDDFPAAATQDRARWDKLKDDEIFQADVTLEKVAP